MIVNEAMARALWPDENPLGKCIRFTAATNPCATVIGVVQTAIESSIDEKPSPHLYLSLDNPPIRTWGAATIIVRAAPSRLASVQSATRELLRAAFPGVGPDPQSAAPWTSSLSGRSRRRECRSRPGA